jgi:hypothetical protein
VLDGFLVCTFILYYYTQRDGKHQIALLTLCCVFLILGDDWISYDTYQWYFACCIVLKQMYGTDHTVFTRKRTGLSHMYAACTLPPTVTWYRSYYYPATYAFRSCRIKMVRSSETMVPVYQTARLHISEGHRSLQPPSWECWNLQNLSLANRISITCIMLRCECPLPIQLNMPLCYTCAAWYTEVTVC